MRADRVLADSGEGGTRARRERILQPQQQRQQRRRQQQQRQQRRQRRHQQRHHHQHHEEEEEEATVDDAELSALAPPTPRIVVCVCTRVRVGVYVTIREGALMGGRVSCLRTACAGSASLVWLASLCAREQARVCVFLRTRIT